MSTILIVDDEAIITMQLEERLSKMGYKIPGMAVSGEEAVAKARDLKPDVVLMDIVMPGRINGIEAAQTIHEELDIPIVFITAYADDEIIKQAKCVNPYGYIVKPFNELELKAAIEVALFRKASEQKERGRKKTVGGQAPSDEVTEKGPEPGELTEVKAILLDDVFDDINLLLYADQNTKDLILKFSIEKNLKDHHRILFAYSQSSVYTNFRKEIQQGDLVVRNIKNDTADEVVAVLEECLNTFPEKKTPPLRVILDFSDTEDFSKILTLKTMVLEKKARGLPVTGTIAVRIRQLEHDQMKSLYEGISTILISTGKDTWISFSHPSYPSESLSVVPQATIDSIVKKSLELVVLSFLEKPISGYDIIREIQSHYHVLVPQARIYTLLYDLREKGYLEMKTSGKSKQYYPTDVGRKYIGHKLNEFKYIFQHILGGQVDEITRSGDQN